MAKKTKKAAKPGESTICRNRRAHRNYEVGDKLEAGIVLTGTEVKSCRAGQAQLKDAYVQIIKDEAFLVGAHISEYTYGNQFNHEPDRTRKLLLHRREIHRLGVRIRERGFSVIPLAMYFKRGNVKVEIALAKGKTHTDKRDTVRDREASREMQRALRRGNR